MENEAEYIYNKELQTWKIYSEAEKKELTEIKQQFSML